MVGSLNDRFIAHLLLSVTVKIMKIDQYLMKFWQNLMAYVLNHPTHMARHRRQNSPAFNQSMKLAINK